MARRKKSNSGGVLGGLALLALFAIASIPKEVWIAIGVIGFVALVLYAVNKSKNVAAPPPAPAAKAPPPPSPASMPRQVPRATTSQAQPSARAASFPSVAGVRSGAGSSLRTPRHLADDTPVSVGSTGSAASSGSAYKVPQPPQDMGPATWIPAGKSISIAGTTIPGGLVYFGASLPTVQGGTDPSLINTTKTVAAAGDYAASHFGYWPSYSDITPAARRAYLNWLVGGRNDPRADIGFVFLFFYGLERRATIDAAADEGAKADWPAITTELRRLLGIYGDLSASFDGYATRLLQWISLASVSNRLYEDPIPAFERSYDLPFHIRLALGQAAKDGRPVPPELALAWVRLEASIPLRTAATRCPLEFDRLFIAAYEATHGTGMVLPRNRTKLKFVYRPASAGLRGYNELSLSFKETPDVTVLKTPLKTLAEIAGTASAQLDAYSRYVGKNPGTGASLEALVNLPVAGWPDTAQKTIQAIHSRLVEGSTSLPLQQLLNSFGCKTALGKAQMALFADALESSGIGLEPDVLGGAKPPKAEDQVVLFPTTADAPKLRATAPYLVASLTLQLASAVAAADGDFSLDEARHLRDTVMSWKHLSPAQTQRLLAHVQLLRLAPASLAALTKKLEPIEPAIKETIATFMASVAQADGIISPDEVKMLEKIYKALGVEPRKVFTDVHAAATGAAQVATAASTPADSAFKLDLERIASLQKDTERVSSLLANIFTETPEAVSTPAPVEAQAEVAATTPPPPAGLRGLDEAHATLVRTLLSRPEWSRAELEDVAADLDLMLDGALEHINEAAFDARDMPLLEGDDPVTINSEFLEETHDGRAYSTERP